MGLEEAAGGQGHKQEGRAWPGGGPGGGELSSKKKRRTGPTHMHKHVIRPKGFLIKRAPVVPKATTWFLWGHGIATGLTMCPPPTPQAVCYLIFCSCCGKRNKQPPSPTQPQTFPHPAQESSHHL